MFQRDMPPITGELSLSYNSGCGLKIHNPRDGLSTVIVAVQGEEGFVDLNGNGVLDSGEPTKTTDANGSYTFTNLTIGSYAVRLNLSYPNVALTVPADGGHVINLTGNLTGIDFGAVP